MSRSEALEGEAFATINGLPGVIVDAPQGPVQTAAFEIEDT